MSIEEDIGPQEVNTQQVAIIGVISAVLAFVLIVMVQAFFYWVEKNQEREKGVAAPLMNTVSQIAAQREALESYRWVDQKKQIVAVPISVAMQLVVEQKYAFPAAVPAKAAEPAKKGTDAPAEPPKKAP